MTVNNFFFLNIKKAQLILCLFFMSPFAWAASEFLTGFKLNSCSLKYCYQLTVEKDGQAERSSLGTIYAFGSAELLIFSNDKTIHLSLHGEDGFYDPNRSQVILRKVREKNMKDIILDTHSGEVSVY